MHPTKILNTRKKLPSAGLDRLPRSRPPKLLGILLLLPPGHCGERLRGEMLKKDPGDLPNISNMDNLWIIYGSGNLMIIYRIYVNIPSGDLT